MALLARTEGLAGCDSQTRPQRTAPDRFAIFPVQDIRIAPFLRRTTVWRVLADDGRHRTFFGDELKYRAFIPASILEPRGVGLTVLPKPQDDGETPVFPAEVSVSRVFAPYAPRVVFLAAKPAVEVEVACPRDGC